jgi:hypothetical protein
MKASQLKSAQVSSKITTDDCKQFIAHTFTTLPAMCEQYFNHSAEAQEVLSEMQLAKNWKRTQRIKASSEYLSFLMLNTDSDSVGNETHIHVYSAHPPLGPHGELAHDVRLDIKDVAWVRQFELDSEHCWNCVVVEDVAGKLYMAKVDMD